MAEYTWDEDDDDGGSHSFEVKSGSGATYGEIDSLTITTNGMGGGTSRPEVKLTVIYEDDSETVESDQISLESGLSLNHVKFHDADVIPDIVRDESTDDIEGSAEIVATHPDEGTLSGVVRKADVFKLSF